MPATMYAVTLGSLSSLVTRVSKKPLSNITATEIITCATGGKFCNNIFVKSLYFVLLYDILNLT